MLRIGFIATVVTALLLTVLGTGCPFPGNVGVTMLVQPATLDFGNALEQLTVTVNKNVTSSSLGPIVAESKAPWITVGACDSTEDNCVSTMAIDNVIIPVRIDRSLMIAGTNRGAVVLKAPGASDVTIPVVAEDEIQVAFDAAPRAPRVNQVVAFTNQSVTMEGTGPIIDARWDFGDGTTSALENPTHSYAAPGVYAVSLRVTTATLRQERLLRAGFIAVEQSTPTAAFSPSASEVTAGTLVTFTNLSTAVPGNPIVSYAWNFGDGFTSTESDPAHQYTQPGSYTVTLTVTAEHGGDTTTSTILVSDVVAPNAEFTLSQMEPYVNEPVQCVSVTDPGSDTSMQYLWNFGDGIVTQEVNPFHTFKAIGNYTVTLTVLTTAGRSKISHTYHVTYRPPVAGFEADNLNPSTGKKVEFTDISLGGTDPIISWLWTFGDGTSTAIQRASGVTSGDTTHVYTREGFFTVSLTVTTSSSENNTDTIKHTRLIQVVVPPAPAFTIDDPSAITTRAVVFTNKTELGTEDNVTYEWNFDDPASNTNIVRTENASHLFTEPGIYNVVLKAVTPTRSVKSAPLAIVVSKPPTCAFAVLSTSPNTLEAVQFLDQSTRDGGSPIIGYEWNLGDGTTSVLRNPTHLYPKKGTYTVKLALVYRHDSTGEELRTAAVAHDVVISEPLPPTASFTADNCCGMTGIPIVFTDTSVKGTAEISQWLWDFGDETTSTEQNPQHVYTEVGEHVVKLTVVDTYGLTDSTAPNPEIPGDPDDNVVVTVTLARELDRFVRSDDGAFKFELPGSSYNNPTKLTIAEGGLNVTLGKAYTLRMTSQLWRSVDEVYPNEWTHNVTIIEPAQRTTDTALLYIDGGSFGSAAMSGDELTQYGVLSFITGAVMVRIDNVPGQPLVFEDERDENDNPLRQRTEDEIIAYSYRKFLDNYKAGNVDNNWPVLFPMAKAAVKAMDATMQLNTNARAKDFVPPSDFVVAGGSKRGWTTWLTGIADCRVKAIAPIVIDVLNMSKQMEHHYKAYGFWAPSIYDYAQMRVFDELVPTSGQLSEAAQALLNLVDPYQYQERVADLPKMMMNATKDQFFLPDSSQFYFDELRAANDETYLDYIPNRSHGLAESLDPSEPAVNDLLAFFMSVSQDKALPVVNFQFEQDASNSITLEVDAAHEPTKVTLWQIYNPLARDFRADSPYGYLDWVPTVLTKISSTGGKVRYNGSVAIPGAGEGYRAFYLQAEIPISAEFSDPIVKQKYDLPVFHFTSGVRVLPNTYQKFDSTSDNLTYPGVTYLTIHGDTAADCAQQYGEKMAQEIQDFLPQYIAGSGVPVSVLDTFWTSQSALMSQYTPEILDEIEAVANGAGIAPEIVHRAHMVFAFTSNQNASLAAWGDAVDSTTVPAFWGYPSSVQTYTNNDTLASLESSHLCVVYYIGRQGFPQAFVAPVGLVFGHTGVNFAGISIAETKAASMVMGILNSSAAMRQMLYDANSMRSAFDIMSAMTPTTLNSYIINDGRNEMRGVKALGQGAPGLGYILANGANDPYAPNVRNEVVYSVQTGDEADAWAAIGLGVLTGTSIRDFAATLGNVGTNSYNVMTNSTAFTIDLQVAPNGGDAYDAPWSGAIDLQSKLPQTQ